MEELTVKFDFMCDGNVSRTFLKESDPLLVAPTLYLKEETADVHFLIEKDDQTHRIPAHKNILAEQSPVFLQMFYGPLKEHGDVKITDEHFIVSRDGFEEFLQIFYSYDMQITTKNSIEIYLLADKYDLPAWKVSCLKFLYTTLTIKIIFNAWDLAEKFDLLELKELCEQTFQREAKKIFSSDEFLNCDRDRLKHILALKSYYCDELTKFTACINWAKTSCERKNIDGTVLQNCREELGYCFSFFCFERMNAQEWIKFQSNFTNMLSSDEIKNILNSMETLHLDTDEEYDGATADYTEESDDSSDNDFEEDLFR